MNGYPFSGRFHGAAEPTPKDDLALEDERNEVRVSRARSRVTELRHIAEGVVVRPGLRAELSHDFTAPAPKSEGSESACHDFTEGGK